jgi:hypothetical protein
MPVSKLLLVSQDKVAPVSAHTTYRRSLGATGAVGFIKCRTPRASGEGGVSVQQKGTPPQHATKGKAHFNSTHKPVISSTTLVRENAMKREPLEPPRWPEESQDTLANIGRCIVAWGVLEREIGFAIEDCLPIPDDLSTAVSANLAITGKLNLVRSLIGQWGEYFGEALHRDLDKICGETHKAAVHYRDFLAHGQPWPVEFENETIWVWSKTSAKRGGVKSTLLRFREGDMAHMAKEITTLVGKWHTFREKMQDGVELIKFINRS